MNKDYKIISNEFVFTSEQVDFMYKKYIETGNTKYCEEYFNVSRHVVLKQFSKNNLKKIDFCDRKFYKGMTIDRTCFSDFSDEKACYFYGLLLADASLSCKSNSVQLSLHGSDFEILKELKDWLKSSNNITSSRSQRHAGGKITEMCSFSFGDKKIAENLKLQGFEPRKTTREKLPLFLETDPENAKHFWRGFIDGDGHIAQRRSSILELCGSLEILTGFVEYCKSLGLSEKSIRKDSKSSNFYRVGYSGDEARVIARELYKNSQVSLKRKYEVYLQFEDFQKHVDSRNKPEDMKYIMKRVNSYIVQVNGKYVASTKTEEQAKIIRDNYLVSNKD